MRKQIDIDAAKAFWQGRTLRRGNTRVEWHGDDIVLRLFGNPIARRHPATDGQTSCTISMCGWPTVTTRARLNGLGLMVNQTDYQQYVWGQPIDPSQAYNVDFRTREVTPLGSRVSSRYVMEAS